MFLCSPTAAWRAELWGGQLYLIFAQSSWLTQSRFDTSKLFGEAAGDAIENEDLVEMSDTPKSHLQKHIDEQQHYHVYSSNCLRNEDIEHILELVDN
jgi:hypothetical protein